MPINCKQPNVYQYVESWTTEANEYYILCAACRTTSLNTKFQATYIANSDGNRQTRTAEITRHSSSPPRRGGGGGGGGGGRGGGAAVNCQCISVYCSFGARDITLVCS